MIQLKSIEELHLMRESAQLVSKTLGMLAKEIRPGVTTNHLDRLGAEFIRDHGAEPEPESRLHEGGCARNAGVASTV